MNSKRSQELPVNVIVMLILGVIIFSMGIVLFSKFYDKGEDEIGEIKRITRDEFLKLECADDTSYLCIPVVKTKGERKLTVQAYVTNYKEQYERTLKITGGGSASCGAGGGSAQVRVYDKEFVIKSSESIAIPIHIYDINLKDESCFVTIELKDETVTTPPLTTDQKISEKETLIISP